MPNISNIGSPHTRGVRYVGRENKGFVVTPKSDGATSGWGKPLTDPDGNPIIPGTPGGPDPVKFIGKSGERPWGHRNTPGTQFSGEISWLGKLKRVGHEHKGKHVLTFHGPNSRYFPNDTFSYGSDDAHNNVYYEGLCIAVAPFPVLGAALNITTDEAGNKVYTLRVICYNGSEDVAYSRVVKLGMGVDRDSYSDTFRAAQMALYAPIIREDGWVTLGYMQCTTSSQGTSRSVKAPRTPWFFDSTGTVAQCMREADITLNRGDQTVTQQGYVRYKATFTAGGVALSVPDNTSGFQWEVAMLVEAKPNMVRTTKFPYYTGTPPVPHHWRVHHANTKVTPSGSYVIAVDYNDTEEKLLTARYDGWIEIEQYFYKGIDDTVGAGHAPGYSNEGVQYGDFWTFLQTPEGTPPYAGDGWLAWALTLNVTLKLEGDGFTDGGSWLYKTISGSKTAYETGTSDPNDPWLYFAFYSSHYPHYISLPRPHRSFKREEYLYQSEYNIGRVSKFSADTEHYSKESTIGYSVPSFMEKNYPPSYDYTSIYGTEGVHKGWLFTDLEAYWMGGVSLTRLFYCVDSAYPMDLVIPPEQLDPRKGMYGHSQPFAVDNKWPTIPDLLQSISKSYREGQHAEDSLGHFCVSIKYTDENGNEKYYNALDGDTGRLDSLTSASGANIRYYPLGEL